MNFNTEEDTQTISFVVTHRTKEQLDHLYNALNKPVTHDKLIVLLLQAYYMRAAETTLSIESQLKFQGLKDEISQESVDKSNAYNIAEEVPPECRQWLRRDYAHDKPPQVMISGKPQYTKHGVRYSPIEPRVSP